MPKLKKEPKKATKVNEAPKDEPKQMDTLSFRDHLKVIIQEDKRFPSIRSFAMNNEETLGYVSSLVTQTFSAPKNPSKKILDAVANFYNVDYGYSKKITHTFTLK